MIIFELNKIDGGVFKTYYEALEEGLKIGVEKINGVHTFMTLLRAYNKKMKRRKIHLEI